MFDFKTFRDYKYQTKLFHQNSQEVMAVHKYQFNISHNNTS